MVLRLLGVETLPGPSDRADAIAVALCHVASMGFPTVSRPAATRRTR
jgi:Holliday junction resolvasome RuvABC endonuclease subunit